MTADKFKAFYFKTHHSAIYFANTLVRNSAIAEDIVSDCYVKLYSNLHWGNDEDKAKRLLFTLIRNGALNTRKQLSIESKINKAFLAASNQNQDAEILNKLVRSEIHSEISNNIEKLPPLSRKVFKLFFFDQLSTKEISKQLHASENYVRTHILKARRFLRASLKGESLVADIPAQPERNAQISIQIKTDEINAELIKHLAKHPQSIYDLSPARYEELVAELLKDMGYEVYLTPQTRDGGRDIIAIITIPPNQKIVTLVECKKWSPSRKIQPEQVKSFLYTLNDQDKANFGMMATTSFFSPGAKELQKIHKWKLSLNDFDRMNEWLVNYGQWHKSSGLWLPNNPLIDSENN